MGSVSHLGYFGERAGRKANPFPRRVLIGAMALLAFSAAAIVFVASSGLTGRASALATNLLL